MNSTKLHKPVSGRPDDLFILFLTGQAGQCPVTLGPSTTSPATTALISFYLNVIFISGTTVCIQREYITSHLSTWKRLSPHLSPRLLELASSQFEYNIYVATILIAYGHFFKAIMHFLCRRPH